MTSEREFTWYLTFISIIFGVFLSVWVEPFARLLEALDPDPTSEVTLGSVVFTLVGVQGFLMFCILICLWWWYGIFLGQLAPARGFLMYFYDFMSLGTFAVAARFWHEGAVFPVAVIFAASLMMGRFWSASKTIWLAPGSNEKKALWGALMVLIATVIFLAGGLAFTETVPTEELGRRVVFLMIAGIGATIYAVFVTEGFVWGRFAPFMMMPRDKLKLILPEAPEEIERVEIERTIRISSITSQEFENDLRNSKLSGQRSIHFSKVHTLGDVEVQATLLCLPSVEKLEEVRAKSFLTFFGHWLDDICDTGLLQTAVRESIISEKMPEVREVVKGSCDKNFAEFVQLMLGKIGYCSFMEVGFKRLLLGSVLFHGDSLADLARMLHDKSLNEELKDDGELLAKVSTINSKFVDLTTKTVQELWLGLEDGKLDFRLAFLYSLLYAPALYYHDFEEEKRYGELDAKDWGNIEEDEAAELIKTVGEELKKVEDSRYLRRAWQIRAVTLSFMGVLPSVVQEAYDQVGKNLGTGSPPGPRS